MGRTGTSSTMASGPRRFTALLCVLIAASAALAASAEAASPAWKVAGVTGPTNLPPADGATPGSGEILVLVTNVGGASSSGPITLRVGPLPTGITTSATPTGTGWTCTPGAGQTDVTCESSSSLPAEIALGGGANGPAVTVPVGIGPGAESSSLVPLSVEGGGALPAGGDEYGMPLTVSPIPAPPGVQALWAGAYDADGLPSTQAGGHPAHAGALFRLNTVLSPSGQIVPAGDARDIYVEPPAGFIGNPMVSSARCPQEERSLFEPVPGLGFLQGGEACSSSAILGRIEPFVQAFDGAELSTNQPLFNDKPAVGYPAEFNFFYVRSPVSLLGSLHSDADYGVKLTVPLVPLIYKTYGGYSVLNGNPKGTSKPFLTNPSDCAEQARTQPVTTIGIDTWQAPEVISSRTVDVPPVTGCDKLEFGTPNVPVGFTFQPSDTTGSSGVGATAHLHIDQPGLTDPNRLATPHLKRSVVTLPAGLDLNPSAANGLEACSTAQIGLLTTEGAPPNRIRFDESPVGCPDASKIGTATISTPLLEEKLEGTVYLAAQNDNPFHSLFAIYIVVDDAKTGTVVKLPGRLDLDSGNGQITATFDDNPQVPFEDLVLHIRGGGPRSNLATPGVCGPYTTTGSWTPWSAPESGPPAQTSDGFTVSSGCSSSASTRPFSPRFEAGTTNPKAGGYSPLLIQVNRNDGEQELNRLDFTLPLGVVAKLAGVPYCSESAIAAAGGKSGRYEQANPSCPGASQIGTVDTAAGVGSEPFHAGGKVYLAGPYKGAPLSVVVITPAVAGPFDLGNVVVRSPLFLNLETAQVTAKSDPIPTILDGVPLKVRAVTVKIDRSDFVLNPTNCEPQQFAANLGSSNGATATPSNRFQVDGCDKLGFKPGLKLSLKGATRRSGHPALKAVVTYPKEGAYSNIARAQVGLPHSEFLDQGNLDKVCTQPELKSATCPTRAIYGHAKAWTPLLAEPLEGPVYIGVGYGHKLPDLVADLNGQVRILLHGKVDTTNHEGLRNTFEVVPDAPVSRFVLEMKGGKKYGLLENSENLCRKDQRASALFTAQNGIALHLNPLIANDCKKKAKGKKTKPQKRAKR